MTTTLPTSSPEVLPSAEELRTRAQNALRWIGADVELSTESGEHGGVAVRTPITGDTLFTLPASSTEDVDNAITEAAQAFSQWRTTPAPVRGALVARLGELLTEHKKDLAELVTIEAGKIVSEALGEVQAMIDICQFAVGLSRQIGRASCRERG